MQNAESAPKFAVAGDVYAILAAGADTAGAMTLIEANVPPDGGPPPHTQNDVESFYILHGEVTFMVEGKEVIARKGDYLRVEPGQLHAFKNRSSHSARMLLQTMPAGLDDYFREVGRPAKSMDDHQPPTPEEIDKLKALAPKFGIEIKI
ncbi:MAG: cupin domain-containing protein [Phycisphaerae bacterium]